MHEYILKMWVYASRFEQGGRDLRDLVFFLSSEFNQVYWGTIILLDILIHSRPHGNFWKLKKKYISFFLSQKVNFNVGFSNFKLAFPTLILAFTAWN